MRTLTALFAAAIVGAPATASATPLTQLASLVVSASSEYPSLPTWDGPKRFAVDDNVTTGWNAGGYGGWLQLDFGAEYLVSQVTVWGARVPNGCAGANGFCFNSYELSGSDDGIHFTNLAAGAYAINGAPALPLTPQAAGSRNQAGNFGHVTNFAINEPMLRYLRWTYTGGTDWAHIMEMDVQGAASVTVPEPGTLGAALLGLALLAAAIRRPSH